MQTKYHKRVFKSVLGLAFAFLCVPTLTHADIVSNLIGHWTFDEGAGGIAADSSSSGNTGNITSPTWITGNGARIGSGALSFNGSNTQITTTISSANPQTYSIAFWFKTTVASGKKIFGFETNQTGTNSSDYDRHVYMGDDGKIRFGWYSGALNLLTSQNVLTDGQWHHVIVTKNSTTARLYVDGVLQGSGSGSSQNISGYWRMGGYKLGSFWQDGSDGYFNGSLDDVRLYSRVLTQTDVTELHSYAPVPNGGNEKYRVNHTATVRIAEHNVCYDVTNNSPTNLAIHVPTKTAGEWASFYTYPPQGVTLVSCGGGPVAPVCVPNQGQSCTSPANSCGMTNSGTIQCNGSCNASVPSNALCPQVCVPNQGQSCISSPNACGMTNSGTIQCNGSCNASVPANALCPQVCVPNQGQSCPGVANACGTTGSTGTIQCNGSCNSVAPPVPGAQSCQSAPNACGMRGSGTTDQCGNGCNASVPANALCPQVCSPNQGQSCPGVANACGITGSNGTIQCDGSCSAVAPPVPGARQCSTTNACGQITFGQTDQCGNGCNATPAPVPGAQACVSGANACGMTNLGQTDQCGNGCNATVPAVPGARSCQSAPNACGATNSGQTDQCGNGCNATVPAVPGVQSCSVSNICGSASGQTDQCGNGCSAVAPMIPGVQSCTSAPNICNMTSSGTTDQCGNNCNAVTPPDNICPVLGCTDPNAINYNNAATQNDGSCIYPTCSWQNISDVPISCSGLGGENPDRGPWGICDLNNRDTVNTSEGCINVGIWQNRWRCSCI